MVCPVARQTRVRAVGQDHNPMNVAGKPTLTYDPQNLPAKRVGWIGDSNMQRIAITMRICSL